MPLSEHLPRSSPIIRRLALGTAQFGQAYGIANRAGAVTAAEAGAIVARAVACGWDTLDTAIAYGQSEQRLGEIGVTGWRVVTKLPAVPADCRDVGTWVTANVTASLARLHVNSLYGLLLHRPGQLTGDGGEALYAALGKARDAGLTERIGVSIYDPAELHALMPRFAFGLVQAPYNIVDRRLADSGWLVRLKTAGVEVHTRSAFLQGLLLMDPADRPAEFARWRSLWDQWDAWRQSTGTSAVAACLGFVLATPEVDRAVIGVDSLRQLDDIILAAATPVRGVPDTLASRDLDLINPSRWNAL